jgi:hypothetical protein
MLYSLNDPTINGLGNADKTTDEVYLMELHFGAVVVIKYAYFMQLCPEIEQSTYLFRMTTGF